MDGPVPRRPGGGAALLVAASAMSPAFGAAPGPAAGGGVLPRGACGYPYGCPPGTGAGVLPRGTPPGGVPGAPPDGIPGTPAGGVPGTP
ncbi:hypothetical protein HDC93_001130 [Streptomyces sp. AK010]|nr:hypothetical protein [Streptomyces sp. AK010]